MRRGCEEVAHECSLKRVLNIDPKVKIRWSALTVSAKKYGLLLEKVVHVNLPLSFFKLLPKDVKMVDFMKISVNTGLERPDDVKFALSHLVGILGEVSRWKKSLSKQDICRWHQCFYKCVIKLRNPFML